MKKPFFSNPWVLGVAAALYFVVVATVGLPCVFHQLTHLYCPGCGATRSVWALVRGDIGLAVRQNGWFVLFVIPWLVGLALAWAGKSKEWGKSVRDISKRMTYLTAYSCIGFFVLRNVPLAAFDFLRPI